MWMEQATSHSGLVGTADDRVGLMGWGWLFANALDGDLIACPYRKNLETISMDLSNLWEIEHKRILCHGSRTRRHETRRESWRFTLGSLRVEDISRPAKSGANFSPSLLFSPSIHLHRPPSIMNSRYDWSSLQIISRGFAPANASC